MDADLADVFAFSSWPEIGKLSWSTSDGVASSSGNLDTECSFTVPQNSMSSSKIDGSSLERLQNPGCHDQGMQVPWSQTYMNSIGGMQQSHSESTMLASQLNNMLELQNACTSVRPSQSQTDGLLQTLPPRLQETACNVLQRLSRGSSRLPKLCRSPSISSSGSDLSSCQQISCGTSESIALHHQNYSGVHYPSPLGLVQPNSQFLFVPEEAHHLRKRVWGDEGWHHPQACIYNRLDQGHGRQVRPCQLPHSQSTTEVSTVATRPRTRARRGQATDPHSIAERQRRERISDRIKQLQELVPNTNKTDKAQMLDEIIEYVKFLRLQVKVFSMSRLGATGAVAPLVAEGSSEGLNNFTTAMLHSSSSSTSVDTGGDGNVSATEEEVAKMMEKDMSAALRYLQSQGLCLMPISLATAISAKDSRQSRSFTGAPEN